MADLTRWTGRGVGWRRREMGLVGKLTFGTRFETMPRMVRRPTGMRTRWPGRSFWSEE